MRLISHRGNLAGRDPKNENHPDKISGVLSLGFDCEIDLWNKDKRWYLGHDAQTHEVDLEFFSNPKLWIHAKNLDALNNIPRSLNFFWHQTDDFALTSKNFIWTFPEKEVREKSIIVDNSRNWREKHYNCFGVCTDYIYR